MLLLVNPMNVLPTSAKQVFMCCPHPQQHRSDKCSSVLAPFSCQWQLHPAGDDKYTLSMQMAIRLHLSYLVLVMNRRCATSADAGIFLALWPAWFHLLLGCRPAWLGAGAIYNLRCVLGQFTLNEHCRLGVLSERLPTCGVILGVGKGHQSEAEMSADDRASKYVLCQHDLEGKHWWIVVRVSSTTGNIKVSDFFVILRASAAEPVPQVPPFHPQALNARPIAEQRATVLHFGDRGFPKGMGVAGQYQISKDE